MLTNHLRDLTGFGFFLFAMLISVVAAWQHPSILAWLYAFHNGLLAFFYARRRPAKHYDRTGLWLGQTILVERPVSLADEEGCLGIFSVFAACQVAPDSFSSDFAQINRTAFSAFGAAYNPMLNSDLSSLEVNIIDRQRTKFGCTQSGVQQGQDNRLIAIGAWPVHDELFSLFSLRFSRIDTGLHNLFDVFFGKSFNGMYLKFRRRDFYGWIGVLELHMQPTEKGTESDPYVANRLGGQRLGAAVEAHRLVLGAQPGQVTGEVGCLNFGNAPITNVVQPMVESVLVGGDCA